MESNHNDRGRLIRNLLLIIGIPVLIIVISVVFIMNMEEKDKPPYSEYLAFFQNNQVEEFVYDQNNGKLSILLKEEYRDQIDENMKVNKKGYIEYTVPETMFFSSAIEENA